MALKSSEPWILPDGPGAVVIYAWQRANFLENCILITECDHHLLPFGRIRSQLCPRRLILMSALG